MADMLGKAEQKLYEISWMKSLISQLCWGEFKVNKEVLNLVKLIDLGLREQKG